MKNIRELAKSKMFSKLQKLGAHGSLKAAHKGENAPRKYAAGGMVGGDQEVGGGSGKPSLSKAVRRGKGGKGPKESKGGKGTNVNVIIMPKDGESAGKPPMPPPGPMAGPPGGPPAGPPPHPMPPPGAGGPPMPMRASGGRVSADCKEAVHKHEKGMHKGQGLTKLRFGGKAQKKRADGGSVLSGDSKREIDRIEDDTPRSIANPNALATGAGVGTILSRSAPRSAKALGALATGYFGSRTINDTKEMFRNAAEQNRIRRGRAEPGKEDRKHGGKVK